MSMKILTYLINLDGSNQRLENATRLLDEQGVEFQRIAAFDGREKSLFELEDYNNEKAQQFMGRELLNAEVGCYLSHVKCVQEFLQTDADYLIVLEDDMKVVAGFKHKINSMLKFLSAHSDVKWNVINIGPKKRKLAKQIYSIDSHDLSKAYYFPIRTIGLIWSRAGAEEFMSVHETVFAPIDNYLQYWLSSNGKGLSVWPPLVQPSGFESEIDKHRSAKSHVLSKPLSLKYRRQSRMWSIRLKAIKNMIFD